MIRMFVPQMFADKSLLMHFMWFLIFSLTYHIFHTYVQTYWPWCVNNAIIIVLTNETFIGDSNKKLRNIAALAKTGSTWNYLVLLETGSKGTGLDSSHPSTWTRGRRYQMVQERSHSNLSMPLDQENHSSAITHVGFEVACSALRELLEELSGTVHQVPSRCPESAAVSAASWRSPTASGPSRDLWIITQMVRESLAI